MLLGVGRGLRRGGVRVKMLVSCECGVIMVSARDVAVPLVPLRKGENSGKRNCLWLRAISRCVCTQERMSLVVVVSGATRSSDVLSRQ